MKLILFLAVAGLVEAGPQLDGIMKDVNEIKENSTLVVNPAPPEVYPAPEADPTPEVDPATEEFSSGGKEDMSKSRERRSKIDSEKQDCYDNCKKERAQGISGPPCEWCLDTW